MIKAVINLEASRGHVFRVLTDYAGYVQWLPGCEQCNILSASGNTAETEIVINSMKRMKLVLRFDSQPTQALIFRMIGGKDLKAYAGSYRLMDSADGRGTVLITEMGIDAGAMVPRFMVDRLARKSIDETASALRQHLQKTPPSTMQATGSGRATIADYTHGRAKRILQVIRTPDGYRLWIKGNTHIIKVR